MARAPRLVIATSAPSVVASGTVYRRVRLVVDGRRVLALGGLGRGGIEHGRAVGPAIGDRVVLVLDKLARVILVRGGILRDDVTARELLHVGRRVTPGSSHVPLAIVDCDVGAKVGLPRALDDAARSAEDDTHDSAHDTADDQDRSESAPEHLIALLRD